MERKSNKINFIRSIKGKLILFFVLVGALPALIIGLITYNSGAGAIKEESFAKLEAVKQIKQNQVEQYFVEREGDMAVLTKTVATLQDESFAKLTSVRDIKKAQIESYFGERLGDVSVLSGSGDVITAMVAMENAFEADGGRIGGSGWSAAEAKYSSWLVQYEQEYGYYDLFLIAENGDIVYTVEGESDLGENLLTGSLRNSPAGKAFAAGLSGVSIQDFEPYAPSGGDPCAFVSAPIRKNGQTIGVVMLQIPLEAINNIMQQRSGMGQTGEVYLVGSDKLMRSNSYLDPVGHSVKASFAGTVASNGVDTAAARNALAGQTAAEVVLDYNGNYVLSAYSPIDIGGLRWAILAEIDVAEAFSPVDATGTEFFAEYVSAYGYYDLFLMTADGYVYYTASKESDYQTNMVNGKYSNSNLGALTRNVISTKQFGVADFKSYEPSNGAPAAFIAQPVMDRGNVVSVVALQLPLSAINDIMSERTGLGETGETYLIGPDKLMRSDSFLDPVGHSVDASINGTVQANGVDTEAAVAALAGNADTKIIDDYNGNSVLSSYAPLNINGLDWAIIAEIDEAEVMASSNTLLQLFIIVLVISILAVMAVGFFVARMIANPLVAMVPVANGVAEGDIDQTVNVTGKDEVGQMAVAFSGVIEYMQEMAEAAGKIADGDLTVDIKPKSEKDALGNAFSKMTESLRSVIGQASSAANGLLEASGQMANASEQAGQATQGIASTSQQVAKGAEEQSQSIQDTTGSMEQLSKAIDQIAQGAQEQARGIQQASGVVNQVSSASEQVATSSQGAAEGSRNAAEAAQGGAETVGKTIDGMQKIMAAMGLASEKVTDLGSRSNEIGKIVATIDDIAAQTNLLALNAAIEAARAGEQGRGFAVVADEVRKLAERSSMATKEIADLITGIQSGVEQAVKAMEDGNTQVEEGNQFAGEAGEALKAILEASTGVSSQIEQISAAAEELQASSSEMVKVIDGVSSIVEESTAATEQMAANSSEVTKSLESVAGISEQNSAATQEISASAEEMSAQVQQVVASSQSLSEMATDLQKAVSTFTLE